MRFLPAYEQPLTEVSLLNEFFCNFILKLYQQAQVDTKFDSIKLKYQSLLNISLHAVTQA